MVIHDTKECYIHIPKCGGIAITNGWIKRYRKNENGRYIFSHRNWQGTLQADYVRQGLKKELKGFTYNNIHATYDQLAVTCPDYKYYTVIRNPLTRWESLYKHAVDNGFVVDWNIIEWTEKAISSLEKGGYWGTAQDLTYFEKSHVRLGSYHVMYLPAWVYYREPEVEVHRLEDQTIWEAIGLPKVYGHRSITQLAPYNTERVKEMIYNYYRKDFERWQMTE